MSAEPGRDEAVDVARGPGDPAFLGVVTAVLASGARVRFRASGSSMAPAIVDGDQVTVEPAAAGSLRRGDVVLARRGGAVVVHRVVRIAGRGADHPALVLRGDAADACDPALPASAVLGLVVAVDRGGRAVDVTRRRFRLMAGARLAAARLARAVRGLVAGARELRSRR